MTVTTRDEADVTVTFSVTGLPNGVSCSEGCGQITVVPDTPRNHVLTLRAQASAPAVNGDTVTVRAVAPSDTTTENFSLTVQAAPPPPPQNVPSVSGQVYDPATGQAIGGAVVAMQDSANGQFSTQADSRGNFRFTSSSNKPIAPGSLLFLANKDGFQANDPVEKEGRAGQALTGVRIALKAVAAATTAAPAATLETGLPTDLPSEQAVNTVAAGGSEGDGGGGMLSWLLIGMGGLLVALGIGAIALLLIRRRNDDDEDDEAEVAQRPRPRTPAPQPGAVGMYHGAPDPTMVPRAAAIGDQTMVTRPALADAPTAMQRPLADEFPDPYNPPRGPQQPGYGPPPQGYPQPQPPGYGAPPPQPAYAPQPPVAYGSPAGRAQVEPYRGGEYSDVTSPVYPPSAPGSGGGYTGYDQGGYDDGYRQAPAGYGSAAPPSGYAPQPNGYGAPQPNGYEQAGGYEQPGGYAPTERYDQGGGYDQGGYGGAQYPGGYDQGGGYEQGGYDPRGYVPEQRQGYEAGGYYDGGGDSRHGAGQQQPGRGERRSLDWLDD